MFGRYSTDDHCTVGFSGISHACYCSVNLESTEIDAEGEMTQSAFSGVAKKPAIDCFYVYPTVSIDPGGNSDLIPNKEEAGVILNQTARFRSVCRVYAPLYRQVTLTALRARVLGETMPIDGKPAQRVGFKLTCVQEIWVFASKPNEPIG